MLTPIPFEELSVALKRAVATGNFTPGDDSIILFDLSRLEALARELCQAFPADALHAVAVKANPLLAVLRVLRDLGLGAEVASPGELALAVKAGFKPEQIVFDSPVKSAADLLTALKLSVRINADSLEELARISQLLPVVLPKPRHIGVRINPQTATGATAYTVTAGKYSKFGVALTEKRAELLEAYRRYSWLDTVHVHVGSQSCSIATLVEAIASVMQFVQEVNARTNSQIKFVDLGGGLPAAYHRSGSVASFGEYRQALQERCPQLFSGDLCLITEFGRHLHATCGTVFSRVEVVKEQCGTKTAMIHVGADLLVRECYNPGDWHHDLAIFTASGDLKTSTASEPQTIAGPLCFSGDILARDRSLPSIHAADIVGIADIGAYSFSMWSRYNSRQRPKIVGYRDDGSFTLIQDRESLESVVAGWS